MGTSTPLAINASLHKKLPYDPAKDFMPLALIATVPFVLVVNNDLPAHSVREFIALAKSKPGAFSYGSTGPGTPFHLYAELFSSMTGIQMVHVPYKAAVAAQVDLMGGRLQVMMTDFTSSLQLIREGKLRALGVTTKSRAPARARTSRRSPSLACPGSKPRRGRWWSRRRRRRSPSSTDCMPSSRPSWRCRRPGRRSPASGSFRRTPARPRSCRRSSGPEIVRWGDVVKRSGASVE